MDWVIALLLSAVVILLIRLEWRLGQLDNRIRVIAGRITTRQNRIHRTFRSDSTPPVERARTTRRDSNDLPQAVRIGSVKRVKTSDSRAENA